MTNPTRCPRGHRLGPGRIVVGWWPCECPAALDNFGGHQTWLCGPCREEGWTTRRYDPPHPRTAADVAAEMVPVQAECERAQSAVDALAGEVGPAAERAAARLRIGRQALEEMETIRSSLSAAEWRAHHGGR
ncbi:hypothetical protein GCM10023191_102110 [Actinoallomurus oryzae]|uniref:Uncharacterized protein n=1 Tax=Actinoallomurus oryzae TaxID=502180 RepID=A0ABP8R9V8_9ACTN